MTNILLRHLARYTPGLLLATLAAAAPSAAHAQQAQAGLPPNVEILWAGIFEGSPHNPRLIENTTRIPLQRGLRFGVRLIVHAPAPVLTEFGHVTRFPQPGRKIPGGRLLPEVSSISECMREVPCMIGYELTDREDLLPGVWHAEVWSGNSKIHDQEFIVGNAL